MSIVICGLAAVVGQASKAPPPPIQFLRSLLTWQLPAAQKLYQHFPKPPSPHPSQYPTLDYSDNNKDIMYTVGTLIRKTGDYLVSGSRSFKEEIWEGFTSYYILFLSNWPFCITEKSSFHQSLVYNLKNLLNVIFTKYFTTFQIICYLLFTLRTLSPTVTKWNQNISPPSPPTVQSQAPLLTCGSCWTAAKGGHKIVISLTVAFSR